MTVSNIKEASILRPRQNLIEHLEGLLENAKSGDLTAIIAVGSWQGQGVSHGWSLPKGAPIRTMLGEMDILKHILIDDELYRE